MAASITTIVIEIVTSKSTTITRITTMTITKPPSKIVSYVKDEDNKDGGEGEGVLIVTMIFSWRG
jgi:hypothetical protein